MTTKNIGEIYKVQLAKTTTPPYTKFICIDFFLLLFWMYH